MVLTDIETASRVKELHEDVILTIPGVWGVGVGIGNMGVAEQAQQKEIRAPEKDGYVIKIFVHSKIEDTEYEFAYDWEVLHHIYPEVRHIYIRNVARLLQKPCSNLSSAGDHYLSTSTCVRPGGRQTGLNSLLVRCNC